MSQAKAQLVGEHPQPGTVAELFTPGAAASPAFIPARLKEQAIDSRCRRMVEMHPHPLLLLTRTGEVDFANRAAARDFGYAAGDMLGVHVDMLVPGAARLHGDALARAGLRHAEPHTIIAGTDLVARRQDGTSFLVEIDMNAIQTDIGPMVAAAIVDVTAPRQAGEARERRALDLVQSNEDLQEFAYIASHDLRAPVRAISLLADWISEDINGIALPDTLDNLRLMRQRAARLEMLLDGLLRYSATGHLKAALEHLDLAALVADVVQSIAPPPGFAVRYLGSLASIDTPRPPLEHVLQNLIANAIRHHDRGTGQIDIHATRYKDGTKFCVRDDGPGIAPAYHKRVFAIFQTLKSRDDCETSGVGLSIVQKTVESRGGTVWIESEPPRRGTAFLFTWPDTLS
jgi:PAS domain S-box-containing protein